MLPSAEDIIARRRLLSAKYDAKQGTTKKLSHPPLGTSNSTASASHHGLEYKGLKYPAPTPFIQEINSENRSTSESASEQYLDGEPSRRPDDFCNSPRIAMKLPSVEDIVARRKRLPSNNTSYPQPGETSTILEEEEEDEPVAPELVRALQAVGWCPTPRGSTPRRRSLDNLSLPDEIFLDELLSNQRDYDTDLLSIDQAEAGKRSLSVNVECKISTSRAQQVGPLVAAEANILKKSLYESHKSREAEDKSTIKQEVESTQLSSNNTSVTEGRGWGTRMDLHEEGRESKSTFDPGEEEKSVFPPRDCSNIGLQKQKRCTGLGLRRHMVLVPPPKRRVDLSELYVNEVVLVKRDRNIWVFAQLKILTCRGIRAWVPNVQLYINIPIEIMYTHLRKVEDDEEIKGLPEFAACAVLGDEDHKKEQRIPLPTTFDRGKNFRTISHRLPKRQKQLHLVRPAHLAHRILHQPVESTLPCTICFRVMSLMDAHKPWDCEHSCHLFCYQLVLQGANSNSCNTCSAGKSWDWKTISCQCGFLGFVQKRVDDLEPPPVCPSCGKPSPILNLYRSSSNSGSELALRSSVPVTSSNTTVDKLMASPFQRSTSLEELKTLPKLSRRAISLEELEWRHVNCECGLRGMIRTSVDSSKPPMCPACWNPVQEWSIPNEDDLLKALLGYTPTDSLTSSSGASTSLSQTTSPLLHDRSSSNIYHTVSSESDFSLFDGVKPSKNSTPTLFTTNNTPSSTRSVSSPETSRYISCPSSPQCGSPAPSSPPREPLYISPSLVSSPMATLSTTLSRPINQGPTPSPNQHMAPMFSPIGSNTELKCPNITGLQSPRTLVGHSSRKPTISPTSSPKPLRPFQSTKRHQLPTDALAFRVTRSQIKQQMEEQAKKQIAQVLETKLTEPEQMQSTSTIASNQDTSANSEGMWMAPLIESSAEELSEQSMQDRFGVTNEAHKRPLPRKSSSTDTIAMSVTPELIQQMMMEEEMKQMSDPRAVKIQSPPLISNQAPPTTLKKSSSTDSVSMEMTPELIKQMMMKEERKQEEQDPNSLRSASRFPYPQLSNPPIQPGHLPTDSVSMWMTAAKIKSIAMAEQRRKEQDLDQPEPLPKLTKRNLPTDSASLWLTPSKIKQMVMMEEDPEIHDHKQDPPLTLGEELRRPISTIEEEPDDLHEEKPATLQMSDPSLKVQTSLQMTPNKVKKMQELHARHVAHFNPQLVSISSGSKDLGPEKQWQQGQYSTPLTEETISSQEPPQTRQALAKLSRRSSSTNSVSMWMTPELIKQMEEELQHRGQDSTPSTKQGAFVHLPTQRIQQKQASRERPRRSSSTDSVSMLMTPELIKQMMMEEELRQQEQEPTSSVKLMASIEEVPEPKQPSSISMPKEKSSTNSISMGMTPELLKQMMRDGELRQQGPDPNSSRSTPTLANPPVQIQHLPIDSTSMWMTPTKVKQMAMEEERRRQQDQPKPQPKVTKRNLPTDSASLWLTPSKVKQIVMMEEEIRSHLQDPPITLGDEVRRSISTIEEESEEVLDEEDSTTLYMSGTSPSTKQGSYDVAYDKSKRTQESQQDYIDETNDIKDDVSSSQPKETKPVQILKRFPLTLQLIPEEEATHKMNPETRYSQPSGSSSSSLSQPFEPTSLATRLQKLKATKSLSSYMLPDIPNQPDQPTEIVESGWITLVKDGQASLSIDKKELEMKAKEVEHRRGIE